MCVCARVFAKNGAACRDGELVPLLRRLDAEIQALRDSIDVLHDREG